jgi:hypothetical protein
VRQNTIIIYLLCALFSALLTQNALPQLPQPLPFYSEIKKEEGRSLPLFVGLN